MNTVVNINIIARVASEDFWTPEQPTVEYSGHMYFGSPFESADSCGTCNGAKCDYCHKIVTPSCWSFSTYSDTLYKWVLEEGVPEDIAKELVYSDYCRHSYKGYNLVWPTEEMLEESHPEFYRAITTPDKEVLSVIESYKGKFEWYGDLQCAVKEHYGLWKYCSNGHVCNQLELYWIGCDFDHKKACGI